MRFLLASLALAAGCGGTTVVPLLRTAGVPTTVTPADAVPLEVVTRATGVRDPLPVAGAHVAYAEVETALGHAISSAAAPWADKHQGQHPEGYQLFVELIRADAEYGGGRLMVTMDSRATLRTRAGNRYLAQTQGHCRQAALVAVEDAAPVVYSCMARMGRDLSGWLGGIEP